jgi:hypothetical protein
VRDGAAEHRAPRSSSVMARTSVSGPCWRRTAATPTCPAKPVRARLEIVVRRSRPSGGEVVEEYRIEAASPYEPYEPTLHIVKHKNWSFPMFI